MKRHLLLFLCLFVAGVSADPCKDTFIHISGWGEAEFRRLVEDTLANQPVNRLPWLTIELEPQILIESSAHLETVIDTVRCCGLTREEVRGILLQHLSAREQGFVPLQSFLEEAFKMAAKKSGSTCRMNCLRTALTHLHYLYTELDKPAQNAEAVEHFLEPVARREDLQWGDILVIRTDGAVSHVMVNLANGIVVHKPGNMAPARIEPLKSAMALYTHSQDLNRLEIWRKKDASPEELIESFSPSPVRRGFWWWWPF